MQYNKLLNYKIFENIDLKEFESLSNCLKFFFENYTKNQMVFIEGENIVNLGLVLKGALAIEHYDINGNANIISVIKEGEIFGESYAANNNSPILVNVRALEDSNILFMNTNRLFTTCHANCNFHRQIIKNLFEIMAIKNINLSNKILHSSPKTIREKIETFLGTQKLINESNSFFIQFDRQQMADYLNVERSALSGELSKMKKEGLIEYRKNHFKILW